VLAAVVFLALAMAGGSASDWERVYSAGAGAGLGAIVVIDDGSWVAAGGDLIVRGTGGAVQATPQPGRSIVGLAGGRKAPLLAVGSDDLILRWSGVTWVQESLRVDAEKLSRSRRRALMLQGAVQLERDGIIAYGPWRVLARQTDGTWVAPEEAERYRLMTLAQFGPHAPRPKGCDRLQWRWLSDGAGWLSCRDRRSYLVDAGGTAIDRGRLPRSCADSVGSVSRRGEALFATCGEGEVWRSQGTRWERLPAPKVVAVAVDDRCLYGVADRAVWRNCALR
jgi:hypothetical protein